MLEFHKVQNEEDIQIFANLKIQLIKYHSKYAYQQGINDLEINDYNYERACKNIFTRDSFILKLNNDVIGILQIEEQISEIDNTPIIYIHSLYLHEKYRNQGFGIYVLKFLCTTYKRRIECSCWYDIPASKLYQKIGFRNLYTRYFLPIDNRFYDSDQN